MANNEKNLSLLSVRNLANQPGTSNVLHYFDLCIKEWKDELVDAKGDEIYRLQGAIKKLSDELIRLRRNTEPTLFKDGAYDGEGIMAARKDTA